MASEKIFGTPFLYRGECMEDRLVLRVSRFDDQLEQVVLRGLHKDTSGGAPMKVAPLFWYGWDDCRYQQSFCATDDSH